MVDAHHRAAGGVVVTMEHDAVGHVFPLAVHEGLVAMRPRPIIDDMTVGGAAARAAAAVARQGFEPIAERGVGAQRRRREQYQRDRYGGEPHAGSPLSWRAHSGTCRRRRSISLVHIVL